MGRCEDLGHASEAEEAGDADRQVDDLLVGPESSEAEPELVVEGGVVIYDSSVIADVPALPRGVKVIGVPMTQIASELGRLVVKNVVALGALQAATEIFPEETFLTAIRQALKSRCAMIPLNEDAFSRGSQAVRTRAS